MTQAKADAARKIREWSADPVVFVRDNFKVEPDLWQQEALRAWGSDDPDKKRISLQACVGPGKTAVLSWCGWQFLACHAEPGHYPKGAAVSITGDNLASNLWPEFARWQDESPFLLKAFQWTKSRIFAKEKPATWFLDARSWSKTANAEEQGRTLSGLHSKYVFVLLDESGEIPVSVLKAGEQIMSTHGRKKMIQAGNPTSLDGILYAAATTLSHLWYVIRITNDPDDPMRSPRTDKEWARQQIETFGKDNPWVMSSILGKFPPSSINSLLGPDEIRDAMKRHYKEDAYMYSQKRLGVDVARFGLDRTVIFPRQGIAAFKPIEMRNARNNEIAARVIAAKIKWGSELEFIDDTGGFGGGVIDSMREGGNHGIPVCAAGKAIDQRYKNKRAECWFRAADWVKKGGALPNMPELVKEASTATYTFIGGKFQLEPKDLIKKRLGFSPDYWDALSLTFAHDDAPAALPFPLQRPTNQVAHDYDPFQNS